MEILRTEGLTRWFGGLCAVNDVNFSMSVSEIVGLIGPNGAGKTTLINLLSGTFPPSKGRIIYQGQDIARLKPHTINQMGIARTFQVVRIFKKLTVMENVLTGLVDRRRLGPWGLIWGSFGKRSCAISQDKEACETAQGLLDFVGIAEYRNELAENLPYAYSKRLEIARALATHPQLLLLDEPSSGLNPREQDDQIEIIRKINGQGTAILIIEHVMKVIMSISHRLIVLHYGQKIAEGGAEEVYRDPQVVEAYLGEQVDAES
jgi:branched-chain amino acid transport system ATP-binding protein